MQSQASEGPSGGGPSVSAVGRRSAVPLSDVEELQHPKLLRTVSKKYNIDSTKSLVAAYNTTTDLQERAVLLGWIIRYDRRKDECLNSDTVLEYAELAKIKLRAEQDGKLLRNLVCSFDSRLRQDEFPEETSQRLSTKS